MVLFYAGFSNIRIILWCLADKKPRIEAILYSVHNFTGDFQFYEKIQYHLPTFPPKAIDIFVLSCSYNYHALLFLFVMFLDGTDGKRLENSC